jgi:hypothetical protein
MVTPDRRFQFVAGSPLSRDGVFQSGSVVKARSSYF